MKCKFEHCGLCCNCGSEHYKMDCVPCEAAVQMTNADRIRSMSDREIAEFVCCNSIKTLCDIICGGDCKAVATLKKSSDWICKELVLKWLQQPAEEDDHA